MKKFISAIPELQESGLDECEGFEDVQISLDDPAPDHGGFGVDQELIVLLSAVSIAKVEDDDDDDVDPDDDIVSGLETAKVVNLKI